MIIRRKHWAVQTGYDIVTDLSYGFKLCLGCGDGQSYYHLGSEARRVYRWFIDCHWDWPLIEWADKYWHVSEPGMVKGLPIRRQQTRLMAMAGPRYWPRRVYWPFKFKVRRFE